MIYMDYNATAPWSASVKRYFEDGLSEDWINPSSVHALGERGSTLLKMARSEIAETINCPPANIVFTSGATESINSILNYRNLKYLGVSIVLSSRLEHSASLTCLKESESQGCEVGWIKNNSQGDLDLDSLELLLSGRSGILVSISHVNNETGVIADVEAIRKISSKHGALLHVDCAQSLGKVPLDLVSLNADFVSLSGHKIGAMKGAGLLVFSEEKFLPLILGGQQEMGLRGGTTNLVAIRSFQFALKDIDFELTKRLSLLRDELESSILTLSDDFRINGNLKRRIYNTANIYFKGINNLELLLYLSVNDIFVSTGSACTSGSIEPSHVIQEMGFDREFARSCLRFSIGPDTTPEKVSQTTAAIRTFISKG